MNINKILLIILVLFTNTKSLAIDPDMQSNLQVFLINLGATCALRNYEVYNMNKHGVDSSNNLELPLACAIGCIAVLSVIHNSKETTKSLIANTASSSLGVLFGSYLIPTYYDMRSLSNRG